MGREHWVEGWRYGEWGQALPDGLAEAFPGFPAAGFLLQTVPLSAFLLLTTESPCQGKTLEQTLSTPQAWAKQSVTSRRDQAPRRCMHQKATPP